MTTRALSLGQRGHQYLMGQTFISIFLNRLRTELDELVLIGQNILTLQTFALKNEKKNWKKINLYFWIFLIGSTSQKALAKYPQKLWGKRMIMDLNYKTQNETAAKNI
jgi:hypothetical protein